MTTEVFDKLDALIFFLLPEFQMTVNTGGYDEVRPKDVALRIFYICYNWHAVTSALHCVI